ncbi:MAG: F0F1 ATP synthase subunit B [Verrucomicrobiota bacterium]
MTQYLMLAAASAEQGVPQQIAETFGWHGSLFLSQVISFCVVAFLLNKFAYKPILNLLAERQKTIQQGLENADKIKIELANAQVKAQELLTQAGAQANKIIEEARIAAAKVTETEMQKAVGTANQIISKAKESNEAEFKRLELELKREIGHLAVKAAMQVSGKILTADDQKRLAEETNRQLAA